MVQYDRYSTQRVNEKYTRRQMKQMILRLKPETFEAFREYCDKHNVSKQAVLEKYVESLIKEDEET